ncbi:IS1 family transposase [[Leptolyngbya] sp. PCC 7376]|uniref:IS1 family transposase n=1 Tax=[Leptolyngbya] sp. PCC 7376 TaxID=111781 RepID=UPI001CEDD74A|nr:IS1 family transposase [[Leptolyngbya] sp. PCC 7376]
MLTCPQCQSPSTIKYGHTHSGKQRYRCHECGRQFVEHPAHPPIATDTRQLIDRLLLERLSLAGITRATGVSLRWLQYYVNAKLETVPHELPVTPKKRGQLTIEMDELWSFVGSKGEKAWIWLALDRDTREVVGYAIGDRSQKTAKQLWDSLPPVYRQRALVYTDYWDAYGCVLPSKRHRVVGKETGQTNHIERFNNTLRQRTSRLVRQALSFSKKWENHIGAVVYFLRHYNLSLQL